MFYNIKDMVRNGKKVRFVKYRHGEMIYVTECGFEFPVPIHDTGDGVFLAEDKAMMFMRYIRKHIESIDNERNRLITEEIDNEIIDKLVNMSVHPAFQNLVFVDGISDELRQHLDNMSTADKEACEKFAISAIAAGKAIRRSFGDQP